MIFHKRAKIHLLPSMSCRKIDAESRRADNFFLLLHGIYTTLLICSQKILSEVSMHHSLHDKLSQVSDLSLLGEKTVYQNQGNMFAIRSHISYSNPTRLPFHRFQYRFSCFRLLFSFFFCCCREDWALPARLHCNARRRKNEASEEFFFLFIFPVLL